MPPSYAGHQVIYTNVPAVYSGSPPSAYTNPVNVIGWSHPGMAAASPFPFSAAPPVLQQLPSVYPPSPGVSSYTSSLAVAPTVLRPPAMEEVSSTATAQAAADASAAQCGLGYAFGSVAMPSVITNVSETGSEITFVPAPRCPAGPAVSTSSGISGSTLSQGSEITFVPSPQGVTQSGAGRCAEQSVGTISGAVFRAPTAGTDEGADEARSQAEASNEASPDASSTSRPIKRIVVASGAALGSRCGCW